MTKLKIVSNIEMVHSAIGSYVATWTISPSHATNSFLSMFFTSL